MIRVGYGSLNCVAWYDYMFTKHEEDSMSGNVFYRLNPLLISLAFAGSLLVAVEIGFRAKGRKKVDSDNIEKSDIALILGGVMTLLALMLGFTFVMSQGRFETRRQLVVEEANAIETTYLRARTLPEPQSSEIQELLRQYTALRIEIASIKDDTPENIREVDEQTKQLHSLIWSHAAALARERLYPGGPQERTENER
jgi:hypothetical protein